MEKKEKKTKKKDKVKESEDTQKTNKTTKQERKSNISVCEFIIKTSATSVYYVQYLVLYVKL